MHTLMRILGIVLTVTLLGTAVSVGAETQSKTEPRNFSNSDITKVVMLGTGHPVPNPNRNGPAVAIIVNEQPYLFDTGEGIWRATGASSEFWGFGGAVKGLHPSKLKYVFLTHLHSDHTIGLPAILIQAWGFGSMGRKAPAQVWGPPGTKKLVNHIVEAYQGDIVERVYGPTHKNDSGWRSVGHNIDAPGIVYQDDNIKVEAFLSKHSDYPRTYAYRVTTPDRVIAISGDTTPAEGVLDAAKGADILLHEVYGLEHLGNAPWGKGGGGIGKIIGLFHTSTKELAEIANQTRPGLLVLYHEQNYSDDPDTNVREIRQYGYRGKVISSRDGDVF